MDPNQRKRKAPPLPKFQQPLAKDPSVVEKVADFLQQISKQVSAQQVTQKQATPPVPTPTPTPDPQKKKLTLASLSSKLNSIMSTKKIDLNKVVQSSKKTEAEPKHRRDIQIQYDPAHPNSYEQSKSHYVDLFQKLRNSGGQVKDDDYDQRISKMIADYEKDGGDGDAGDAMDQEPVEVQGNRLDDRESLALRMMQKYGFKVGQGLGKQSQGIKTPLTIKKLTDSSCKIELSEYSLANFVTTEQLAENALKAFKIQKSPVIAMKIAMKLNELTDEVESEIKEECSKYGSIEGWVAYSTTQDIVFFCLYASLDEAFKAFTRLNGRYYDQKIINVFFYPYQAFKHNNFTEQFHQILQF